MKVLTAPKGSGFPEIELMSYCENCGDQPAVMCQAATAYHWDGTGENPNRDVWLCYDCREDYYGHWNERWEEYYSGCM